METIEEPQLQIQLPNETPYTCGRDFLIEEENGWFSWIGAGQFEDDYCAFEGYRTIEEAAADALFKLAIADGKDSAEAVMVVYLAKLPTDHLDTENIDYE